MSEIPGIIKTNKGELKLPESEVSSETVVTDEAGVAVKACGTVLLVDDEEILLTVGADVLESYGYNVLTATNGKEALDLYRERQCEINLVLLDLIMPVMGGIEAYKELRKISPSVPVVICSGYGVEAISDCIEKDEYISFIEKPYQPDQLQKVLAGFAQ